MHKYSSFKFLFLALFVIGGIFAVSPSVATASDPLINSFWAEPNPATGNPDAFNNAPFLLKWRVYPEQADRCYLLIWRNGAWDDLDPAFEFPQWDNGTPVGFDQFGFGSSQVSDN